MGFFVEVPRALRDQFNELFPAKGSKRIAVIAALKTLIEQELDARSERG